MASDSGKVARPLAMILPTGYRFMPTDKELVLFYLLKKVRGEALPCDVIEERDIYGDGNKEPWKIFGTTSGEKFYVFTKLKKKSVAKRVERSAGCGTWKLQRTDPLKDSRNKNVVGFKKLLVFEIKGCSHSDKAVYGHWLMHEFSLVDDDSDYVLCEIRNKNAKLKDNDCDEVENIPETSQIQTLSHQQQYCQTNDCYINSQEMSSITQEYGKKRVMQTEQEDDQQQHRRLRIFNDSIEENPNALFVYAASDSPNLEQKNCEEGKMVEESGGNMFEELAASTDKFIAEVLCSSIGEFYC